MNIRLIPGASPGTIQEQSKNSEPPGGNSQEDVVQEENSSETITRDTGADYNSDIEGPRASDM